MPHPPEDAAVIRLRGCRQHNLRDLDLDIPHGRLTVVTGPSGSGKSSLAFHTLYAEGQRRYVETFSPYVRQFFDRMDKPEVDSIEGIPPAIAIEQKNHVRTTRSTVGTLTEINDYLKLVFARLAAAFDPHTGEELKPDSPESAQQWTLSHLEGRAVVVGFPVAVPPDSKADEIFSLLNQQGYLRVWHQQRLWRTDEAVDKALLKGCSEAHVVQDRIEVGRRQSSRLLEALEAALRLGKGRAAVWEMQGKGGREFTTTWSNPATGFTLRAPSPALFSFNSPIGACPVCRGFGRVIGIDPAKAIPDPSLSIAQGAIKPFQGERGAECQRDLLRCCRERKIDVRTPWEDLSDEQREWIYDGDRGKTPLALEQLDELWRDGGWYGVRGFFTWLESKAYKMHVRVFLSRFRAYTTCATCQGSRLQPEALCFRVAGRTLAELWRMPVSDLLPLFDELVVKHERTARQSDPTLPLVLGEVRSRLACLDQVGLGYLTLDRATRTLSGGELERVNLTACLGAALTGTLFVLDEPTVGLHARDIQRLIGVMQRLRDAGNTLVVVEHERAVIEAADHLIDLGPGAGQHGGRLLHAGPLSGAKNPVGEGTLAWLDGRRSIALPARRRQPDGRLLSIRGATRHNLARLDVDIPLGLFVCVTGVSGSGKSTFAHDVIYQNMARKLGLQLEGEDEAATLRSLAIEGRLDGVELVDQSPVARTPRSAPALLLGAFDPIRQLFCETPEALANGLKPGFFSFNAGEGRCDRCAGNGHEKVEMQFLSDLYVTCPDCNGTRYKASTLEHHLEGMSIADVLNLTVEEALLRFDPAAKRPLGRAKLLEQVVEALNPLAAVGLGYLKLGQPLNTLSGGEAQRVKLCRLLQASAVSSGPCLLILDEPTTGLHFSDIERLLGVLHQLVDAGHSLLVIEHNTEVIQSADWLIDLGPEAGAGGGRLVGEGPPEKVAGLPTPTGELLRRVLKPGRSRSAHKAAKSAATVVDPGLIRLRGARHHNLKNVSVDIPRGRMVVVSGLSGSGKSTLAFDILFAEGQRRFLDSMSTYARQFAEQMEKPELDQLQGLPPTVAIEQRVSQGGGKSTVATVTEVWNFVRLLYARLGTLHCPDCQVPVERQSVAAVENRIRKLLAKGKVSLLAPVIRGRKGYHTEVAEWALKQGFTRMWVDGAWKQAEGFTRLARFREHDVDVEVAVCDKRDSSGLAAAIARALEIGKGVMRVVPASGKAELLSIHSTCPSCRKSYDEPDPRLFSFNSPHGWCPSCRGHGRVPGRRRALDTSRHDSVLEAELDEERVLARMEPEDLVVCPTCKGARLNALAMGVRLGEMTVSGLSRLSIDEAAGHFDGLRFDDKRAALIARDILPEIGQRLGFLQEVGLGYLQLNRSGNTLSGGESQRIRLAAQLGSNLRGVLYVLDEPTIGLHPRDNAALLRTLGRLRDNGNSLIIVEHDEETIASADHLIDLGPGAGRLGGEIVYQGPVAPVKGHESKVMSRSPTLRALHQPLVHPTRGSRRAIGKGHAVLEVKGCRIHNLKGIDVRVPLGRLTVLTGVSGSGKSTLMHECLAVAARKGRSGRPFRSASGFDAIKACHEVDQSPIGKTSRSCPATYVKVFDHIRALFAQLPDSRLRGYDASRFSFNTDNGRCAGCDGNGRVKVEMDFLPSTWVHCEECNGMRYNPATLEARFRDRHIGEVLAMTIDEAAAFFESQPRIAMPLRLMADTGLGYLQLGQPSPTLSGGEAQRIKLVSELISGRGLREQLSGKALAKRNLYLIEEPTVGLHHEDIRRLIDILHRLVDEGHTVVVIEHHMAVAAEADWIIDLGPEAGEGGGRIVAEGTPEKVATSKRSRTAAFLKAALGG